MGLRRHVFQFDSGGGGGGGGQTLHDSVLRRKRFALSAPFKKESACETKTRKQKKENIANSGSRREGRRKAGREAASFRSGGGRIRHPPLSLGASVEVPNHPRAIHTHRHTHTHSFLGASFPIALKVTAVKLCPPRVGLCQLPVKAFFGSTCSGHCLKTRTQQALF